MKSLLNRSLSPGLLIALFYLVVATLAQAQDQTVNGNLGVTGTADIEGNTLTLGTVPSTGGSPGVNLSYVPPSAAGQPQVINFSATPANTLWNWTAAGVPQLTVGGADSSLKLFTPTGGTAVSLSASGPSVFNTGLQTTGLLTASGGVSIPGSLASLQINGATLYRSANGALRTYGPLETGGYIDAGGHIRATGDGVFGGLVIKPSDPAGSDDFSVRNVFLGGTSSEMRLIAGDNALEPYETDRLAIGATDWQTGTWYPRLTVLARGNVGIGTTAPAAPLNLATTSAVSELLRLTAGTPVNSAASTGIVGYDANGFLGRLDFRRWNGASTGLTLSSASYPNLIALRDLKVGIGTETPAALLDVGGNLNVQGKLILPANPFSTTSRLDVTGTARIFDGDLRIDRTTSSDAFYIRNIDEGNFNTEFRLVAGDNALEPYETDRLAIGATDWRTGTWYPRLTVTALGKVGIGTATPAAKLEVAGDVKIRGKLRIPASGDLSMGSFTADGGLGNPAQ